MSEYYFPYDAGKWVLLVDGTGFVQYKGWVEGQWVTTRCDQYEFDSEEAMNAFIAEQGFTHSEF